MTSGVVKARVKFKISEEEGNVVVLFNKNVLEEIMQGKFSIYFGKIIFLKYHFKMVFYYPFLKGDIHLGCSLCISEGIRKTSP